MERTATSKKVHPEKRPTSRLESWRFDVTQVVGTVEIDGNGEYSAYEAAMLVIARHDAPGTFTFPTPDGGERRVTIEQSAPGLVA